MEIWKDVKGHEGCYQVSSFGNIKSLERKVKHPKGGLKMIKEKLLNKILDNHGYYNVHLSKDNIKVKKRIHVLVAENFLNHIVNRVNVIDHVNNVKTDNNLLNLQIISQRLNNTKDRKRNSGFVGVSKSGIKWRADTGINNKRKHLGMFNCPFSAHVAYTKYLKNETN